jgi:hypothetical protein
MIYLEASLRVVPGKMKELMEVFEKEYLPLSNKFGRKLVAQWTTSIGTLMKLLTSGPTKTSPTCSASTKREPRAPNSPRPPNICVRSLPTKRSGLWFRRRFLK